MMQLVTSDKSTALNEFYRRITQIAEAMGGHASPIKSSLLFPIAMVAAPRSEEVPALRVNMPDDLEIEFSPSYP